MPRQNSDSPRWEGTIIEVVKTQYMNHRRSNASLRRGNFYQVQACGDVSTFKDQIFADNVHTNGKKFKDSLLDTKYELISTNVRNTSFGRFYFAKHRSSGDTVVIAKIKQHSTQRIGGKRNDKQILSLIRDSDPRLGELREKIKNRDAIAFIMDFQMGASEFMEPEPEAQAEKCTLLFGCNDLDAVTGDIPYFGL
jgi:hypothetical protein